MTIDKLPSGSYRIRHTENGQTYSVSVKFKPSKSEAMALISDRIKATPVKTTLTFRDACSEYIDSKFNVLSPSTRREYIGTSKRLPDSFLDMRLTQITSLTVQKVVNDLSTALSPKTVSNYASFITAVLKAQEMDIRPPQLPQKVKKSPYIPSEDDIRAVLSAISGTEYEIPLMLCCFGLRRSEVCAVTIDDLDGTKLTVNKAKVKDEKKQWVIKTTKTTESTRTIIIPKNLADKIRERGYIYNGSPYSLPKALKRTQEQLGIPQFPLHKLRHFFASYLHQKGYTDKQIQEMGGWKTDTVMKTVYQHALDMDNAKRSAAEDIASDLFS